MSRNRGPAVLECMVVHRIVFILAVVMGVSSFARAADAPATMPSSASATSQAMALLRDNCFTCHNPEKKKGGLALSSRTAALAGGDDGVVLVPGHATESKLAAALDAAADPHMPPKHQLTAGEIATLRKWIDAGAEWDERVLLAGEADAAPTTRPVTLHPLPAGYRPVLALAMSPDQKRLAAARGDRVRVFDLTTKGRPLEVELATPDEMVYSLAWNADGTLLASGGFRKVRLWDLKGSELVRSFEGFAGRVASVAFSADGETILAGEGEPAYPGVVRSWRVSDGTPIASWTAHADAVFSMKVATGGTLFTASADKLVKAWQLPEGREVAKFEGHTAPVMAVAASPDGKRIASAGADKEIKVWDVKTREQIVALQTSTSAVTDVTWLDDKRLLSAGEDGAALMSSVDNKDRPVRTFSGAADALSAVVAGRDGTVYGGGQDGTVYAWSSSSGKAEAALSAPAESAAPGAATVSFTNDVMPVLSRAGCNAGACHAKPAGQAGFKLSVFAYDPKSDYRAIVKGARGRRLFPGSAEESLLLLKPTQAVKHGGGKRIDRDSEAYRLLVRWIGEGMPYARPGEPTLTRVAVEPRAGRYAQGAVQPLHVTAYYSDGTTRDVTHLADFASNDKELAKVSEDGVARAGTTTGEAAIIARYMGLVDVARVTIPSPHLLPDSDYAALPANNFIDPLVHDRLKSLGILPSATCTDGEFLRRASLDVIGTLPTPAESKAFLDDADPDKRAKLIDRLLADPRYADCWADKWADLLRPNPFRVGVKSVYVFDQWLRDRFRKNVPYDQLAREIVLAQGSTHRDGPVVIYRDRREPADITTLFSQVFLGVRLECAKCHHHPNEKWSQDDFYQLAAFFAPLKRKGQGISAPISGEAEYVWFAPGGELRHPLTNQVMHPRAPEAPDTTPEPPADRDPREALADWMTAPGNPFFARAAANRVWGELMGRGIVHPVDDIRVSNPATNEKLLDALAGDFASHGYDLKHLIRTIMASRAYQRSSLTGESNLRDTKNFSRWYRRRPAAETMLDAVTAATGVPEPLPGLAPGSRAALAWNNRLESDFLDAFSRPNASADPPCERDRDGSIVQALHLMNSAKLAARIADPAGRAARLAKGTASPDEIVNELYLATYCRYPTPEERAIAVGAFDAKGATRQTATEDVLWALLNSAEFVFSH